MIKKNILALINFFYPYFSHLVNLQTFKYLICGGSNAALNLLVFSLSNNLLFFNPVIPIFFFSVSGYIMSYLTALFISFPFGFFLNKYIVFQHSNLNGITQLIRYTTTSISIIFLDYLLLHLFIGYFGFWATPSQALIIVILSLISYFAQTYFSFKTNNNY